MGEDTIQELESSEKITRAYGTQAFTGDIEGEGSVDWLMSYLPAGGARFLGLQRIEGSIGGHTGSFMIESVGDHDGTQSKGTWAVIQGSGSGELSGIRGQGSFHAPGPEVTYTLEYEL